MTDLADSLTSAVRAAPELRQSPTLAVPIAQGADPVGGAQIAAHAVNMTATQDAYQAAVRKHGKGVVDGTLSWLGGSFKGIGHVVGATFNLASVPLREAQHQYRALRDIGERHGTVAALLEGLAIAGGAGVGLIAGGPEGAVLGGELVGGLTTRLYGDSWDRTSSGDEYRDSSGKSVSVGRDAARLIGLRNGSRAFSVISGIGDGVADLVFDPLAQVGSIAGAGRSVEGARGAVLGARLPGLSFATAEHVENAFAKYGSFRNAVAHLATLDAGQIVTQYPKFTEIAEELGAANTGDKVMDVFRDVAKAQELVTKTNTLPTRSMTRIPWSKAKELVGNYEGPLSAQVREVTTFVPRVVEQAGNQVTQSTVIDLAGRDWHKPVYDTIRMGQSRRVAESVVGAIAAEADPAARRVIFKNAVVDSLIARGVPADSEALTRIHNTMDDLTSARDALYGVGVDGRDLSKVVLEDGRQVAAGISLNQVGKVALPKYENVLREVRSVNNARRLYGAADDWVWDKFTAGVFKPLVLLSLGFAQRIAMAEAIPNAFREGVFNTIRSGLNQLDTRFSEARFAEDEIPHVAAAIHSMLGPLNRAVNTPERIELAARNVRSLNGHLLPSALDSAHGGGDAILGAAEKAHNDLTRGLVRGAPAMIGSDAFTFYRTSEPHFVPMWQKALSEQSQDPIFRAAAQTYLDAARSDRTAEEATQAAVLAAKRVIDELPPETLANEVRHRNLSVGAPEGTDPHEDWARTIVESMKGITHTPGGAPHVPILSDIADGKVTTHDSLEAIDGIDRPRMVKGRILKPDSETRIEKIANWGHTKVLGPIINVLARDPIYFSELERQYAVLQPAIEQGLLHADDALALAQVRSTHAVLPFIHNPAERSQMTIALRNYAPFAFAQQQAYARLGRLLVEDPGAFRRYQLIMSSFHDIAFNEKDGQGQTHLIYPGSGFLGNGVPLILKRLGVNVVGSVPVSFSGSVKSLATVSPFLEGDPRKFGPVVGIATHAIDAMFPESTPIMHAITGEQQGSGSLWEQFIPNVTIKRVIQATAGSHQRSFQSAMMSTIQALEHEQNLHPDQNIVPGSDAGPMAQQTFIERVKNQTRILFLVKAAIGAVTPMSPQFEIGDFQLQDQARAYTKKFGLSEGIRRYLDEHPDATPYTVFKSESQAGGPLNASEVAQDFLNSHKGLLEKYPYAAAWLLPQETNPKFSAAVYNEQLAQHLRQRKTPDKFLADVYTAAGFQKYDEAVARRDAAIRSNPEMEKEVRRQFSAFVKDTLGPQNPVWYDYFQSSDRQHSRQLAVKQLTDLFDHGKPPKTQQANDVRSLLADWSQFQGTRLVGQTDAVQNHNKAVKEQWQAYLERTAQEKPQLRPLIDRVFKELT